MTKEDELTAGLQAELDRVNARLAEVKRPQNCGTGYCSCIECVVEQAQPAPSFIARCTLSEQCLPDAPYRAMLCKLHKDMLDEIDRLQAAQPAPVKTYHGGKAWPVAPSDLNPEHIIRQLVTALEGSGTRLRTDQWYVEIEAVAAGKRYLAEMALLGREKMDEEHRAGFDGPPED